MRRGRLPRLAGVITIGQATAIGACSLITDYDLAKPSATNEAGGGNDGFAPPPTSGDGTSPQTDATDTPRDATADSSLACTEVPCVRQIAAAGHASCALIADGTVYCWGSNGSGVVGAPTPGDVTRPRKVVFDGAVDRITMADWGRHGESGCAQRGAVIECWGYDGPERRLGRGGATTSGKFVPVPAPVVGISSPASELSLGYSRGCAILGGTLSCWGQNYDRKISASAATVAIPKLPKQLLGGRGYDCALLDSGEVACAGHVLDWKENWGPDASLGPGQPEMAIVSGLSGVVQAHAGGNHLCALKQGGSVVCLGRNDKGQLGRGVPGASSNVPAPVTLPMEARLIGGGINHTCAVLADSSVWCWGRSGSGTTDYSQRIVSRGVIGTLPDGGLDTIVPTPRKIAGFPTDKITSIVGGYEHACALTERGAIWCWGGNRNGQLGRGGSADASTGDDVAHPTPTRVAF